MLDLGKHVPLDHEEGRNPVAERATHLGLDREDVAVASGADNGRHHVRDVVRDPSREGIR